MVSGLFQNGQLQGSPAMVIGRATRPKWIPGSYRFGSQWIVGHSDKAPGLETGIASRRTGVSLAQRNVPKQSSKSRAG